MGDFSADPETILQDAIAKGYCRVRFQQGKPLLDRELNLLGELAGPQRFAQANFGSGVRGEGNDFLISGLNVANNDFAIRAGSCLVNGYEVTLSANTTYKTQPRKENIANLPGGESNVYLRVFRTETSGTQDPTLLNAGDIGSETAIREKLEWEVLVTTQNITASDHFLLASINTVGPTVRDLRRRGLNVSAIRDEVSTARGSTAQLSVRLGASLSPTGALLPNSVAGGQIADNAVVATKLADNSVINTKIADNAVTANKIADNAVGSTEIADNAVATNKIANNAVISGKIADANITTQKLAPLAVTEPTLATNSVSNRTIANGAVSITKMNSSQQVNLQVSVPAAPSAAQRSEMTVTLQELDEQGFYLISVHFDGPRVPGALAIVRSFDWKHRVALTKAAGNQPFRHFHQIVIENPNTVEITVTVRAFRVMEN